MAEELRKIVKCFYKGEVDVQGLPHGKGELHYIVERDPSEQLLFDDQYNLRYRGEFCHGLRQGEGDLHVMGTGYNPVSESEWYSEGDYDSCGRFAGPAHKPGTWSRYVRVWYPCFEGTWQNDLPLKPRWGEGSAEERVSEMGWQYVRETARDAIATLPFEMNNDD
ncbi:MAG: hypothetical protein IJ739_04090 [Bacteroidaceae bacterium]|nr:hypothetical protein [Bacteroidaceae bacterium]